MWPEQHILLVTLSLLVFAVFFDSFSIIFIHLSATSGTPGSVEPLGSVEPWLITPEVTESEFEAMGYCFIFTV